MTDEIRQTPVPVPVVYGQPNQQATDTPMTGDTPTQTVEQPSSDANVGIAAPAPTTEQAPSPAPAVAATTASASNAPSPAASSNVAAGRTGTPLRTNGQDKETSSSRAASQHPDSGFTMPSEVPPHGAPVRQYLNSQVTGPLLDGMRLIAKEQPKDPLRVLGEYLLQRAKELETSSSQ
ncbi:hypothetical protein F5Y13DRAFT_173879 [Hypoxylon sp. FL1857]|nr:hypothetical protein F5Y13DRAFT_173879 [Hypoxylon sp. FL1857]